MELRFKRLSVDGFRTLKNVELDLSRPGLHFVQGSRDGSIERSNGAGKTSLFASLMFTLYGYAVSFSGRQLKRQDCIPSEAVLKLELEDLTIERVYTSSRSQCLINGSPIRANDIKFIVEKVCDPRVFATCVFLAPISVSREVVFGTAREKLQTIMKMFGLDEFVDSFEKLWKERLREYQNYLLELQNCKSYFLGRINAVETDARLRQQAEKLPELRRKLKEYEDRLKSQQSRLAQLKQALQHLRSLKVIPEWILEELVTKKICPVCHHSVEQPQQIVDREKQKTELERQVSKEIDSINTGILELSGVISAVKSEISQIESALQSSSIRLETFKRTVAEIDSEIDIVTSFLSQANAVQPRKIVQAFAQSFYNSVVSNASKILSYLGLDFSIAVDERLNLLIKEDGRTRSIDSASGGEQARLLLAFSLSLLLTARGSVKPSILVVDEALDILDFDGRRRVLDLLRSIANRFEISIFLISHHDLLNEYDGFDSVIYVRRRGSCTTVERTFLSIS